MDSYVPDNIPQRRAREDDISYDVDVKRRRTDHSPVEPFKTREIIDSRETRVDWSISAADADALESSRTSAMPIVSIKTHQFLFILASRKRTPLPPQSARFREASKNPPPPGRIAPIPGSQYSGKVSDCLLDCLRRHSSQNVVHFTDLLSGTRNQLPTGPSGRSRNRIDNDISHIARDNDPMEVDHRPAPRPPPVRSTSNVVLDRSLPPTGPKAMHSTPSSVSQEMNWQRAPPPHLRQDVATSVGTPFAMVRKYVFRQWLL